MTKNIQNGFTILELAIVLVIIGLITGGLLAGSDMIHSAEIRSIHVDIEKYVSATNKFQDKYESLPGDMYNATDVWDEAHATPATCIITDSGGAATCNGNGNNQIGESSGQQYEFFRAWQQLSNAKLIEGHFSGISQPTVQLDSAVPGDNVPASKVGNTGYTMVYVGTGSGSYYAASDYGHVIHYGAENANTITDEAAIKPEDAWHIDKKIDDGLPGTGFVRSYDNTARSNCADDDAAASAVYSVSNTVLGCNLIFITGF